MCSGSLHVFSWPALHWSSFSKVRGAGDGPSRILQGSTLVGLSGAGLKDAWMPHGQGKFPGAAGDGGRDRNSATNEAAGEMVVKVREAALALQRKDWEHGTLAQEPSSKRTIFIKSSFLPRLPWCCSNQTEDWLWWAMVARPIRPWVARRICAPRRTQAIRSSKMRSTECCTGCSTGRRARAMARSTTSSSGRKCGPTDSMARRPSWRRWGTTMRPSGRLMDLSGGFGIRRKAARAYRLGRGGG